MSGASRTMRPRRLWPSFETPRFARLLRMRSEIFGVTHRPCSLAGPGKALNVCPGVAGRWQCPRIPRGLLSAPATGGRGVAPAQKSEGDGAPIGATVLLFTRALGPRGAFRRAVRRFPCGAGPRFLRTVSFLPGFGRTRRRGGIPPGRGLRTADRPLNGPPSASSSRGPVVVPGGAPAPPECVAANHARGRRPDPHERRNRFASPLGVGRAGIWS